MTRKNMPRRGKVFKVGEEFRIAIHMTIKNFRLNESLKGKIIAFHINMNYDGCVYYRVSSSLFLMIAK